MTALGDLLELLHGAGSTYRSVRATVRLERDEALCLESVRARRGTPPTATGLSSEVEKKHPAPIQRTSTFWIAAPGLVRCERELQLQGESRVAVTVGDGDRWWYQDARFGAEPVEEQLVATELPELELFDPWRLASGFELRPAGRTVCAEREAVTVRATCRHATSLQIPTAERYEIAVDAERGVGLRLAALFDEKPLQVHEVVDISFDEDLDPELFRLDGATEQEEAHASEDRAPEKELLCSFCGKSQSQVMKLIAGPGVYVCDECIDLCNEILDEERRVRGH